MKAPRPRLRQPGSDSNAGIPVRPLSGRHGRDPEDRPDKVARSVWRPSVKTEEGKYEHDHNDQADEIDQTIHGRLRRMMKPELQQSLRVHSSIAAHLISRGRSPAGRAGMDVFGPRVAKRRAEEQILC
jgi:hypothetical protein